MVKKLTVLGIQLNNYSLRDSFLVGEKYFHDDSLNVIRIVTMDQLLEGTRDDEVKKALEEADLCVVEDRTILEEAGINSPGRLNEIKTHEFFPEFMRRVYRNGRSTFILGEDEESIGKFESFMNESYRHIRIAGTGIISEDESVNEKTLNDINILVPDMVISILETPVLDKFLNERKNQIYAKLFIALDANAAGKRKKGLLTMLSGLFTEGVFKRHAKQMGIDSISPHQRSVENDFQSDSPDDAGWNKGDNED